MLEDEAQNTYRRITYSVPLIYDDVVYGVVGIEISLDYLNTYFNLEELNTKLLDTTQRRSPDESVIS